MKAKIDKGFCPSYWGLSYRRKFIRTLWWFPLTGVAAVLLYLGDDIVILGISKWGCFSIVLIGWFIQVTYNYYRWRLERNR